MVDAADEGRLAGAGRPDQAHGLALAHVERHALEHLEATEALVHLAGPHDDVSTCRNGSPGHLPPRAHALTGFHATTSRSRQLSSSPRSLAPSRRSIAACTTVHALVSTRY